MRATTTKATLHVFAGYTAAAVFLLVSMSANLMYGYSLGATAWEKRVYGMASLASDLMKATAPFYVMTAWRCRRWGLLGVAVCVLASTTAFSMCAAIGFAASARGDAVAASTIALQNRTGWQAKIERAEGQLANLGQYRPTTIVQSEIDALLRTEGVDGCARVNGPITREVCPRVDQLRRELSAATEAERLEAELVESRKQLGTVAVTGSAADPQSATLARLTGLGEATVRDGMALLLALLVEIGSVAGFALASLNAQHSGEVPASEPITVLVPPSREPTTAPTAPGTTPHTARDAVERWALDRLDILSTGAIRANAAYDDFCAWCYARNIDHCTSTMFGRCFTEVLDNMGGTKVKRRDGWYYLGAALQSTPP